MARRSLVLVALVLAACTGQAPPAKTEPEAAKATPPGPVAPPVTADTNVEVEAAKPGTTGAKVEAAKPEVKAETKAPMPIPGVRDLRPLGGGTSCVEMYSACSPDGKGRELCTSAPLMLDCGERGKLPSGEALRCVCP